MIRFYVAGRPAPKGSPRVITKGRGGKPLPHPRVLSDSDNSAAWQEFVRSCATAHMERARAQMYEDAALAVRLRFTLPRPGGHYSKSSGLLLPSSPDYPANKAFGDADKLARSTLDGLSEACFDDDGRIVDLLVQKRYGQPMGCLINITEKHGDGDEEIQLEEDIQREAQRRQADQEAGCCPHCGR
jgi:Holliday junction resolvase RusA-like endonuclease